MSQLFGSPSLQWIKFLAIPVLAVIIGAGVAIASSSSSITRDHRSLGTPLQLAPSPSPVQSAPIPTVTQAGIFGQSAHVQPYGASGISVQGLNLAAGSGDGGKTWSTLVPPAKTVGVVIDGANPEHGVTGGSAIQFTVDGGRTWQATQTAPPGPGPFQPLEISPFDGSVWFFIHQGKLLRTRDASLTWRDFTAFPALTSPVLAAGTVVGEFFLASGGRVFQLIDNGQNVAELPALPAGSSVIELAAVGGGQATLLARTANNVLYLLRQSTWSPVAGVTPGPIGAGANGVLLVGNGGAKLGSPGTVAYSFDLGATWREGEGLPYDQSVEALAGQASSATFFAYSYGGDVYVSMDGGASWTVLSRALRTRTG